jgi:hypothetical protein
MTGFGVLSLNRVEKFPLMQEGSERIEGADTGGRAGCWGFLKLLWKSSLLKNSVSHVTLLLGLKSKVSFWIISRRGPGVNPACYFAHDFRLNS